MTGTTSSPLGTARLPPGMNEFCTSTTIRTADASGMVAGYARDKAWVPWPRPWQSSEKGKQCDHKPANIPATRTLHRRTALGNTAGLGPVVDLAGLIPPCSQAPLRPRLGSDFGMRAVAKRLIARSSTTTQKHGGLAFVDREIGVEQFERGLRPCTAHFLSGYFDVIHFYG